MHTYSLVQLLVFYGSFLIACGIISVSFIGLKAKTALLSGSLSGLFALAIAYGMNQGEGFAFQAGVYLPLILFIVFSWRSYKTLFQLFHMIPEKHPDLPSKGIAFLIISLMACVSLFIFILEIIRYPWVTAP